MWVRGLPLWKGVGGASWNIHTADRKYGQCALQELCRSGDPIAPVTMYPLRFCGTTNQSPTQAIHHRPVAKRKTSSVLEVREPTRLRSEGSVSMYRQTSLGP